LPQINLATLYGGMSKLPLYYKTLAGNITDVMTIKNFTKELKLLGYEKVKLVMDRGFYSKANIDRLIKNHIKFICGTKISLEYVSDILDKQRDDIIYFENFKEDIKTYGKMIPFDWYYQEVRLNKGDKIITKKRMYLHLFLSAERKLKDELEFNQQMAQIRSDLLNAKLKKEDKSKATKYFSWKKTPKKGIKVFANDDAMNEAKKNFGCFLLSFLMTKRNHLKFLIFTAIKI
jgi:transposase